jgi:hypothetical protein
VAGHERTAGLQNKERRIGLPVAPGGEVMVSLLAHLTPYALRFLNGVADRVIRLVENGTECSVCSVVVTRERAVGGRKQVVWYSSCRS